MGPSPNALSAPPLAAEHRCQASRIVSTKAPKTEPFLPSLFLSLSLYLCVCVLCFCGYRERGCCACEGFWVLLCFVFKGGFFWGGFLLWRIGQVFKNRSCTWDHCCVLGPPSTRGLCTDYRQYIMLAPFLFIFNTTLFLFFLERNKFY